MDDSEAQLLLTLRSQSLWQTLAERLPPSAEYRQCGTVWVAADEEEMGEVLRKHSVYTSRELPVQVLNRAQLLELEPQLRCDLSGGLLVRSDAVVDPPIVARFLAEESRGHGAELIEAEIVSMGDGVVHCRDGRQLKSRRIINAAGEHSAELTPGIPVKKRKGHLAITDCYPGFLHHQVVELGYLTSAHTVIEDSVAFNVQPRTTGQLVIGSSRQFDSVEGVEPDILERMLARAAAYMPGLADCSVLRVWTGYRGATPDKLPLIGPWQEDETIFLATGHEGLGITSSLVTAELLSTYFSGRVPAIPLEPYLPARVAALVHDS